MASIFPNQQMMPSGHPPDMPQPGQRYQQRQYQPYVFQPNFLKQQMRQREIDKMSRLGNFEDISLLRDRTNSATLNQNATEERKKSGRKVIDWTPSCVLYIANRRWQREGDSPALLPDPSYTIELQSPLAYRNNSASSVATKFVRSATNKMKCPVYKVVWTPDGRRLVTGSASGEFTLWNGTAFNFETILQAHDSPVRAMSWSRNDAWLITGDNQGYIKYWQLNMNNVKMYQAHKDQACRSVCFGPTDAKFVTASDDGTVRIWDFLRCHEEQILRGHGADVKQVDWHPQKSIIASASKDLQTPVKLWDPKSGQSLATVHAHKGTVMDVRFNKNGNWFLTASRDHLIKLYDIRKLKQELQVFRGHKKEAFSVAWHPIHENMFASGGSEGSILFWQVGEDKEIGALEGAHDSLIWSLAWHPLGHVLVSGSNDHSTKFWTRNRPGDPMRDRYNAHPSDENQSAAKPANEDRDSAENPPTIPGMGDTEQAVAQLAKRDEEVSKAGIPGLDWSYEEKNEFDRKLLSQQDSRKRIAYARPVPRSFAQAWDSNKEARRSPSPAFDDPRRFPPRRRPLMEFPPDRFPQRNNFPQEPGFNEQFNPQDPNFNHSDPNFTPQDPNFTHSDPNFNQDPNFNPQDPNFNLQDPNFTHSDPNFNPQDPNFNPQDPNFAHSDPNFNQDPGFNHIDPNFNHLDPNFNPQDPNFIHPDPNYNLQDPNFNPDPNFTPDQGHDPGFDPRDINYRHPDPNFPREFEPGYHDNFPPPEGEMEFPRAPRGGFRGRPRFPPHQRGFPGEFYGEPSESVYVEGEEFNFRPTRGGFRGGRGFRGDKWGRGTPPRPRRGR